MCRSALSCAFPTAGQLRILRAFPAGCALLFDGLSLLLHVHVAANQQAPCAKVAERSLSQMCCLMESMLQCLTMCNMCRASCKNGMKPCIFSDRKSENMLLLLHQQQHIKHDLSCLSNVTYIYRNCVDTYQWAAVICVGLESIMTVHAA